MARTGKKKKKEDEDESDDDPWAWTLKQGVKLTGDQYSLPDGTTAFWKSELRRRRQGESIPWGKTHTPQGDDLVAAIQSLDVNGVTEAIETFSDLEGDKNLRVATTLLYRNHVQRKEQEDAHDEASPMLHVLVNAESMHQETSNSSTTTTAAAQHLEERVRTIAEKLLDVGVHPATRGDYRSAVSYAAEKEAFCTLQAILKAVKARGEMVSGGVTRIGTTRQNLRYGGGGTDVFWMAAKSSDPRILPMVFETLKDELGETKRATTARRLWEG